MNRKEGGYQCWLKFLGEVLSNSAEIIATIKALPMSKGSFAQASSPLGSMSHWHKDFVTIATGHWTNEIISCHGNMIFILLPPGTCSKSSHPPTTSYHRSAPFFFLLVTLLSLAIYIQAPKFMTRCIYMRRLKAGKRKMYCKASLQTGGMPLKCKSWMSQSTEERNHVMLFRHHIFLNKIPLDFERLHYLCLSCRWFLFLLPSPKGKSFSSFHSLCTVSKLHCPILYPLAAWWFGPLKLIIDVPIRDVWWV